MNQFATLLVLVSIIQLALICSCHNNRGQENLHHVESEDGATNNVAAFENDRLGFERVEELLQARAGSELPEENLQVALKLLEGQRGKPDDEKDWPLIKALKQFVALDNIKLKEGAETEGFLCNNQSYAILHNLNLATSGRAKRSKSKRGPLRRIELVLAKVAQDHAKQCKNVYPERFHQLLRTFSSETIEQIDTIMKQLLDARITDRRLNPTGLKVKLSASLVRRALVDFMEHNDSFKTIRDAKIVRDFLSKTSAKADADKIALIRRRTAPNSDTEPKMGLKSVEAIFVSNLLEPCLKYMDLFGPDVYIPAQYDAPVLDRPSRFRPSPRNDGHDDFIDGWVRYGFCFMLKRDKGTLIKKVGTLVSKE